MASTPQGNDSETIKKNKDSSFVDYDAGDFTYFGAEKIVVEERKHILERRRELQHNKSDDVENDLVGLALSGGGIRSASFCLGILQALSYRNVLKKIDYLSTVSGGGYIGSSLTWLLSQSWYKKKEDESKKEDVAAQKIIEESKKEAAAAEDDEIKLGVDKENFPYGTYPMLGQAPISGAKVSDFNKGIAPVHRCALLRYLRQHGKYLTPGHGINGVSLLGVILRGSILSILVYFSLLIILMTILDWLWLFKSFSDFPNLSKISFIDKLPNFAILIGLVGLGIFIFGAPYYSVRAYFKSKRTNKKLNGTQNDKSGSNTEKVIDEIDSRSYHLRRNSEITYNYLLSGVAIFIVIGLIPEMHGKIFSGADKGLWAGITGAISTAVGFISSISAYIKTSSNKKGFIPISLLVLVGTLALWFGLLLLAYNCSQAICGNPYVVVGLGVLVWFLGWNANLNYISIHRYYRDRLMETFMPDVPEVLKPSKSPQQATEKADRVRLSKMCGYRDLTATENAGKSAAPENDTDDDKKEKRHLEMPYHIINTNLVLVSSRKAKFKGRGGDNFILSPAYCGSNATGWRKTANFMEGRMTLPTAMAISGAAVNPSTGVGGDGITRQRFLSMLMGFLNIRLGYWAPNPKHELQSRIPNFFLPGFFEMFTRSQLKEDSQFLQLSDGGHFENLGIYELVRRKARIIISCDGAADPNYEFTDLSNALEKIRVDFGVLIDLPSHQLKPIVPRKKKKLDKTECAQQGFIVAKILYPDAEPGVFIYMKSTFFRELSSDLYGYKQTHKEFPDEPTSDQFFDEKQFEAYRELGYQTAWAMMNHDDIKNDTSLSKFFGTV